jgi:hypothetical protein
MSEQATPLDATNTTDTTNQTDGLAPTQLQLSDLLLAAQAIQLASQRGAFRAEEFTQIGGMFDRVTAFLKDSGILKSGQATGETAEESSAE